MDETLGDDIYGHFEEIPCEFCEESFPFEILGEHQPVCDQNPYNFSTPQSSVSESKAPAASLIQNSASNTIPKKSVPAEAPRLNEVLAKAPATPKKEVHPKTTENVQKQAVASSAQEKAVGISISEKIKRDFISNNILNDIIESEQSTLTFEDSVMQERAPKLMAFGNQNRMRIEEEKPTFKVPSLSHLNKTENRDLDHFSDSEDAQENLEDFWKRAEIKVSQQLKKVIKL